MEIDRPARGHIPDLLRKHPKGDDNKEVGIDLSQALQKLLVSKPLRLEDWDLGQELLSRTLDV